MAQGQTGPAPKTSVIDDFELVRNGQGQWLLVLPGTPDAATDSAFASSHAELIDDDLTLADDAGRVTLQSLLAPHYAQALRTDKPETLHISMVDDEGNTRLLCTIPFRC